jgi:hypothetical protein
MATRKERKETFFGRKIEGMRFQVLTAASMMFRVIFWDILPCKMIVDRRFRGAYCLHHQGWMMEAVRTSETSFDNHFTRQYIPEDKSEHQLKVLRDMIKQVGSCVSLSKQL